MMVTLVTLVTELVTLVTTAGAEKAVVKVSNGWLNMREKPQENAEVIGKLKNGLELDVDGSQNILYFAILSGENIIGWASKSYIQIDKKDAYEYRKFKVLSNYSATSDWKGDVTIVQEIKAGDIVEGRYSVKGFVHLVGGGFVPKNALEEIE